MKIFEENHQIYFDFPRRAFLFTPPCGGRSSSCRSTHPVIDGIYSGEDRIYGLRFCFYPPKRVSTLRRSRLISFAKDLMSCEWRFIFRVVPAQNHHRPKPFRAFSLVRFLLFPPDNSGSLLDRNNGFRTAIVFCEGSNDQ